MSERLIITVNTCNPRNACDITEPIYNATVAASMDYHVELIFSGSSGEILLEGVAEEIQSIKEDGRTIYDLLKEAQQAGVSIKATKHVTLAWGESLIPEVDAVVGAGYVISELMSQNTASLSY